jgi:hypothetical protein
MGVGHVREPCRMTAMTKGPRPSPSDHNLLQYYKMSSYQAHIKTEIPKLRGKGLSAQQAMSAAAKSWREKKQSGGARKSSRVVNADLAKLESLKVPTAVKGKKRRSIKGPPLEVENCTDVESCKLQIRMLLAKKPPDWLASNEMNVRKMVELLLTEDDISKAIDAGKRRLGKVDSEIMRLVKSLPI